MPNPFVHVELNSPDPKKTKEFYSKLFQWHLEDRPNPADSENSYTTIKAGEGTSGGITKQIPGRPSGWLPYVLVDDINATTQKAKLLGGKVMKEVTELTGMGWLSVIQDPTGGLLGLWKPKPR